MRIMLTNDDGIDAPGLHALLSVLERHGDVTVIAPADGQSATSHSLSFSRPLLVSKKRPPGTAPTWRSPDTPPTARVWGCAVCIPLGPASSCPTWWSRA